VRVPDFRTIPRSATLPEPFSVSAEIARLALGLLEKVDTAGGVRLLGVTMSNLTAAAALQESLFLDDGRPAAEAPAAEIESAVDAVRARFGTDAVGPAALIGPGDRLRVHRQGTQYGPEKAPPSD
jgi:DNA polymerase-4